MNGDVRDTHRSPDGVSAVLSTEEFADINIAINRQAIEQLSDTLQKMTTVDVSNDVDQLADLMASIATIAYHKGPTAYDAPQDDANQITPLAHKICADFSTACVMALARSYGYDIPCQTIPQHQTSLALHGNDWEQLVKIFTAALHSAGYKGRDAEAPSNCAETPTVLIRRLEKQFDDASPIPEPEIARAVRQLTAESFSNLRSVAVQQDWTAKEVLMLIEEHLSPELDPHLVYHSSTVSGADWRRLYNYTYWRERGADGQSQKI